jgi:phosphatidylglycerol---prolipoprotein diacylglyceryl transferase
VLPVLFSFGPLTIYTFGILLFIAFFIGLFVIWKRGRELHLDEEDLFTTVFTVLLIALIGGRVGYILTRLDSFGSNPFEWLNLFGKPGLLYLAALISGLGAVYWQAKKRKWDFYNLADVLAVGVTLASAIVALGAFLNGSGYGSPTETFLGIRFPGLEERRHPVQLYEMVLYTGLFALLWWLEGVYRTISWYKGNRSEALSGFIMSVYLIGHGLFGLITGFLRSPGLNLYGIRVDLVVYLLLMLWGGIILNNRSGIKLLTPAKFNLKSKLPPKPVEPRRPDIL